MTGAELQSMLKSNMSFNSLSFVDDESLHLTDDDLKWWRDAKFGLFIHWGVYSKIGHGEWVYHNEKYTEEDYRKIAENDFRPSHTAEEITDGWLSLANDAGMKYAVMVTRHHDGFALWDSKCSYKNFTSMSCGQNADYVRAFTDSCRKYGFYTGLYYSPMDWRCPAYFHPHEYTENAKELKDQCYGQIRELLTNYGEVKILWYDGGWLAHNGSDADAAWFWEPIKLNQMARELQPKILTTPRSGYRGEFLCDEGGHPIKGEIVPLAWEKNMSLCASWGYRPEDRPRSSEAMIKMLSDAVCRDGNLLLNISPDGNGDVIPEAKAVLREMGVWMNKNGDAVYGTRGGPWQPIDDVFGSTKKDGEVFIHVWDREKFAEVTLPDIGIELLSAEDMNGTELEISRLADGFKFELPKSDERVSVIRIKTK